MKFVDDDDDDVSYITDTGLGSLKLHGNARRVRYFETQCTSIDSANKHKVSIVRMMRVKDDLHGGGTERDDGVRVTLRRNLRTAWTHFKHFRLLRRLSTGTGFDTKRHVTRHLGTNKPYWNA